MLETKKLQAMEGGLEPAATQGGAQAGTQGQGKGGARRARGAVGSLKGTALKKYKKDKGAQKLRCFSTPISWAESMPIQYLKFHREPCTRSAGLKVCP